jgi:hypothetical protein
MTIEALILYGSHAREDSGAHSDVDLLGLTLKGDYAMSVQNRTNIALYPFPLAEKMARDGDLFMLHIVSEGKPLFDPRGLFLQLKRRFRYKSSYAATIEAACDLGWALCALRPTVLNVSLFNKRVAWCVRTVLIAKAASDNQAIFSAKSLVQFSGDNSVRTLIANKSSEGVHGDVLAAFRHFLASHSTEVLIGSKWQTADDFRARFVMKNNVVGLKTLRALMATASDMVY